MNTVSGQYHMMDWQEATLAEQPNGSKLTRVDAVFRYEGAYDGRQCSTWLRHSGSFDEHAVKAMVASIPESSTGSLTGMVVANDVAFEGEGPYPLAIAVESRPAL